MVAMSVVVQVEDATRRIAVVDLDWRHVRAVDILSILQSFASGSSGRVRRVTVYPSDYGLERMQAEARAGPQGIYKGADGAAHLHLHASQLSRPGCNMPTPGGGLSAELVPLIPLVIAAQRALEGKRQKRRKRRTVREGRSIASGCAPTSAAACATTTPSLSLTAPPLRAAYTRSATAWSLSTPPASSTCASSPTTWTCPTGRCAMAVLHPAVHQTGKQKGQIMEVDWGASLWRGLAILRGGKGRSAFQPSSALATQGTDAAQPGFSGACVASIGWRGEHWPLVFWW